MDSHSSSLDDELFENVDGTLPKLFTDANLYKTLISQFKDREDSVSSGESGDNVDAPSKPISGFADLIAGDLDSSDKAVAGRVAKISVTGDTWVDFTSEPESYDESSESSGTDEQEETSLDDVPTSEGPPDEQTSKLSPAEIVGLIVDEFGSLAVDDEEEKLILEADAAFSLDVVILGVIHLTTHRLSFHASLLSSRPDLAPAQDIQRSGSAVIHRTGFHKKVKVWIELSHDMLCTYRSSSDEDHIRPLKTILFSDVEELLPFDPKLPKVIVLKFDGKKIAMSGYAEFDTIESAREWRNDIQGAIFLYKHSQRELLINNGTEDTDGVRISIPLAQIDRFRVGDTLKSILSLEIFMAITAAETNQYAKIVLSRFSHMFRFITIRPDAEWDRLQYHIDAAKARRSAAIISDIVVDFGPLSCGEKTDSDLSVDGDGAEKNEESKVESKVRKALSLTNETDVWIARARISRHVTRSGYLVVTEHYVGFWSKLYTKADVRYRLPLSIIKIATPKEPQCLQRHGMALSLDGQKDLQFDFKNHEVREKAIALITAALERQSKASVRSMPTSGATTPITATSTSSGYIPHTPIRSATSILAPLSRTIEKMGIAVDEDIVGARTKYMPKAINLPRDTLFGRKSLHFMCLTIGSRGDVQPYIALALGLKKEGHQVTIVTHEEYKDWVQGFEINHRTAGGDPGALMKLSVEHKMFSPEFFKESLTNFRKWLDDLLVDAWEQCQGADVLLESPSAMAGVHIAEALKIPYFRCFTMPWTKTSSFPHAFLSPPVESPTFNSASYVLFDNVMWAATSGQINRWRRKTMQIGNTDMGHLAQSKITFIYNFSQAVVPKPLDWKDTTVISGYWFLDNPDLNWTPPSTLTEWMAKAREDGKAIVYIGFGSITVPNPNKVTETLVKAVLKSDVRAIISKGWSARMNKASDEPEVIIPPECYQLDKVPHDWLFPQIDAAFHHGGAGTTGASLRAGIPTLIKPWFGDQYFWASRVHKLGAGMRVANIRVNDIAEALTKATTDRIMKEKAAGVGAKIRTEDGVHSAIHTIYMYLDRAAKDRTQLD